MLISAPILRRAIAGALGAGAVTGASLFGALATPVASADPLPPNCTAADFSGVNSGVSRATSDYLFAHPDVNQFFTGLQGLPTDQVRTQVVDYMNAHPQTKAELTGIRQPLVDIKQRCGFSERDPNGPLFP
jgi:heme-binding protein